MALNPAVASAFLNKIFKNMAFSFAPWVSLHTANPGTNGANEVSGGGYGRVDASTIFGNAPVSGALSNSVGVNFTNMPGCTVVYFGVFDAQTGGNFVISGALITPVVVAPGQTLQCSPGQFTVSFDATTNSTWSTYLRGAALAYAFQGTAFALEGFYLSLHTASPGLNGGNEVSGGPGPYARQTISFGVSMGNGQNTNSDQIQFAGLPGVAPTHIGLWDAATNGNFLGGGSINGSPVLNSGDTIEFAAGAIANTLG